MNILQNIKGHDDLCKLTAQQQADLCRQIREFLVESVSRTGGHLASNLGVVELSVAIETVYNTEIDRLVFDVGHQSYVHKLLTNRQADFANLRQMGGIAGFPKPAESASDAFVAGHASSSVSIALGMARARTLTGRDYDVVAVLGDGAATGGMVYEGLNDAAVSGEPMVIVLNDNDMSISPNVGGFAQHLSRLRTKEGYLGLKQRYRNALSKTAFGRKVYRVTRKGKEWLKKVLLQPTIFENMGLTYIGPVDGHDLQSLISLLRLARDMNRPVLLHVVTQKGRGYEPATDNPAKFHGIGKFDPVTGTPLSSGKFTFSDTFGCTVTELAQLDTRVCAITAAMPAGTGLLNFKDQHPDRLFDVGIAEEHAISMAGGLAKQGMIPVVALYSTFLQRGYDQILQDICILKLHVVLAVDRCGLVGEDGETHQGIFDVGFLRQMPGMQILTPANQKQLSSMLTWAVQECNGPVAVRYPRGTDGDLVVSDWHNGDDVIRHRCGADGAIVTYGVLTYQAIAAADALRAMGIEISVVQIARVHPLPIVKLQQHLQKQKHILIAEEAVAGAAQPLAWKLSQLLPDSKIEITDLGKDFVPHGSVKELYECYGLDAESLAEHFKEVRPA